MIDKPRFPGHLPFVKAAADAVTPSSHANLANQAGAIVPLSRLASLVSQAYDAHPEHREGIVVEARKFYAALKVATDAAQAILVQTYADLNLTNPDAPKAVAKAKKFGDPLNVPPVPSKTVTLQ